MSRTSPVSHFSFLFDSGSILAPACLKILRTSLLDLASPWDTLAPRRSGTPINLPKGTNNTAQQASSFHHRTTSNQAEPKGRISRLKNQSRLRLFQLKSNRAISFRKPSLRPPQNKCSSTRDFFHGAPYLQLCCAMQFATPFVFVFFWFPR